MSKPKPMPTYWELAEEVTHLHGNLYKLQAENVKLRELMKDALIYLFAWMGYGKPEWMVEKARDLGIEVDDD